MEFVGVVKCLIIVRLILLLMGKNYFVCVEGYDGWRWVF